jgi:hypothetical protein
MLPIVAGLAIAGTIVNFLGNLFGGARRRKAEALQKAALKTQTQSAINTLTFNIGQKQEDISRMGTVFGEQTGLLKEEQGRTFATQATAMRSSGVALTEGSPLEVALNTAMQQERDVATLQRGQGWALQSAEQEVEYLQTERGLQEDLLSTIVGKKKPIPRKIPIGWETSGGRSANI